MKVEIVHVRDSDSECNVYIFVDGKQIEATEMVTIDPGAGWSREDWNAAVQDAMTRLSVEAAMVAHDAFSAAGDSPYIED